MKAALRALLVLAMVVAGCAAFRALGTVANFPWSDDWTEALLKIGLWVAPVAIALRMWGARGYREVGAALGLTGVPARGYLFGAAACVPVLAAWPLGRALHGASVSLLVSTVIVGPLAEEILFRGWAFRQLWLRAGWPPAAALVVSALAFGAAHMMPNLATVRRLFDSGVPRQEWAALAVPVSAAAAGLLFGWLTWRWNSLWPAVGLHTFMNLSWQLLGGGTSAFAAVRPSSYDPSLPNAIRLSTIALAVLLTWWARRGSAAGSRSMRQ